MDKKLDKKTELAYLINLVMEASSWHLDESDMNLDPIRVEVRHRISVLTGNTDGAARDGIVHNKVPLKKNKSDHGHSNHVRVYVNGKPKWFPKDMCERVPFAKSRTGYKWVLREATDDQA